MISCMHSLWRTLCLMTSENVSFQMSMACTDAMGRSEKMKRMQKMTPPQNLSSSQNQKSAKSRARFSAKQAEPHRQRERICVSTCAAAAD